MTLSEFVGYETSGVLFTVVDATKQGYMTTPHTLTIGCKNVARKQYGDKEVVGFEPQTKRNIVVYVK